MEKLPEAFNSYRERMNIKLHANENKVMKRIFSTDMLAYKDGAISSKVKEMLGLATSMVLRCDDLYQLSPGEMLRTKGYHR